jgi:predicted esterase
MPSPKLHAASLVTRVSRATSLVLALAASWGCDSSLERGPVPAPSVGASGGEASAPSQSNPAAQPALPPSVPEVQPSSEETPDELPLGGPEPAEVGSNGGEQTPVAPDAGVVEPAKPASTGGSGGPVGPAEGVSTGGLSYLIDAPASDTPRGLLILLHGSTASNYENFIRLMRDVASQYDLIPVSVLAPNGQGWNEGNQVRAAELLHQLIQQDLYTLYDIDTTRVLFSGQSSGGGFLASNFIPAHAQDYQGGAFLQCGAAPPNIPFTPTPDTRQNFRLHFEITTEDPIWPEYYALAISAYTEAQMQLSMDNTKPGGHCQFDQQQVILDHIGFVLGSAVTAP